MGTFGFILLAVVFMYVGRKLGWALSRGALYGASTPVAVVLCIVWGLAVAACVKGMILWLQPNVIVKFIFGYFLGAYVAIPNFGLVNESTIPEHAQPRHQMVAAVPMWTYILAAIAGAWLF